MGRVVKRVPVDFDHPMKEVWPGFVNPWYGYRHTCGVCGGDGYSSQSRRFKDEWYGYVHNFDPASIGAEPLRMDSPGLVESVTQKVENAIKRFESGEIEYATYSMGGSLTKEEAISLEIKRMYKIQKNCWEYQLCQADVDALLENESLWDFTRRPFEGMDLQEYIRTRAYYLWIEAGRPETDGVQYWEQAEREYSKYWMPFDNGRKVTAEMVNYWSMFGLGHDSLNQWVCVKARAQREGIDPYCPKCKGEGYFWESKEDEENCNNWEKEEPPTGAAYQIWETVSAGSPASPPFENPEDLAQWMVENDTSLTADTSFEGWMKFILGDGWAPSTLSVNGVPLNGVEGKKSVKNNTKN